MAEYEDNLEDVQQSPTPEFYVLNASGVIERYTSFSRNLTFLGNVYAAASISRGNKSQDLEFGVTKLTVSTPITPNLSKYISNQPIEPVELTIYRSHLDYLYQYEIIFRGEVKSVELDGKLVNASCESKNRILTTMVPSIIYQSYCNHGIYDDGCGVDRFSYQRIAEVTDITGSTITYSFTDGGGAVSDDYFTGGEITFGNDRRLITSQTGSVLDVHIPFDSDLSVGDSIYIYPGCDGAPSTCIDRFNNLNNHLGMSYIPDQNPVTWGFK